MGYFSKLCSQIFIYLNKRNAENCTGTKFWNFLSVHYVNTHLRSLQFPWGFSGDVVPTWASLQFQPYFTHTAANVGYMWSHDIGGHTRPSPPELCT